MTRRPQELNPGARLAYVFNKEAVPALKKLTIMTRKSKLRSVLDFLMPLRVSKAEWNGQK